MKLLLSLLTLTLSSTVMAAVLKIDKIQCYTEQDGNQFSIEVAGLRYNKDQHTLKIASYSAAFVIEGGVEDIMRFQHVQKMSGLETIGAEYNGRKYKDFLSFDLQSNKTSGDMETEEFIVLISPSYKTVKEIKHTNHWDSSITWTEYFRQYQAVLRYSLNDHHGDYAPLTCISRKIVHHK